MIKLFFLFLILNNAIAETKNISCGFGECRPDFESSLYLEKENMSYIDVGDNNDSSISIKLPNNQEPRALFFNVNNNISNGKNLDVDLQSKREGFNTENFILVGDIFNTVNLNTSGYKGVNGLSASDICAQRFIDGTYGVYLRTQYLNRRDGDPTLPMNKCVADDVELLQQTAFNCVDYTNDTAYNQEDFSLVNVSRVKFKQECIGIANQMKCVKRRVIATCTWESLPIGYSAPGYPCTNKYGGNNCQYNVSSSCWSSAPSDAGTSYPAQGTTNPWTVYTDQVNNRCSYPNGVVSSPVPYNVTNGMSGGFYATNLTSQLYERKLKEFESEGRLEEMCRTYSKGPSGQGWRFKGVSNLTYEQPGLDEDTLEPLPGSSTEVKVTGIGETCTQYNDFEFLTNITNTKITYGDVGLSCSDATIAEDPNRMIYWNPTGLKQDRTFGTEFILCSPDNCPVETITKNITVHLDTIQPTAGTNGSSQGDAVVFVYDIKTLNFSGLAGLAGSGGNNDLPQYNDKKYCVKKLDASTQGINAPYALNPLVYFNNYNWDALDIGTGKPNGIDAPYSTKGLKLFKKIDSSVRYLLKSDNF